MVNTAIPILSQGWHEREQYRLGSDVPELWELLDAVCDPEIPVLSLWDLGVLCNIEKRDNKVTVTITPTYSGCPAMETMRQDIAEKLQAAGYERIEIISRLSPAWSSEWMSPEGKRKLREYGIAPPLNQCDCGAIPQDTIECPRCGSNDTHLISEFGSTACKAIFSCRQCREIFDFFKNI